MGDVYKLDAAQAESLRRIDGQVISTYAVVVHAGVWHGAYAAGLIDCEAVSTGEAPLCRVRLTGDGRAALAAYEARRAQ